MDGILNNSILESARLKEQQKILNNILIDREIVLEKAEIENKLKYDQIIFNTIQIIKELQNQIKE